MNNPKKNNDDYNEENIKKVNNFEVSLKKLEANEVLKKNNGLSNLFHSRLKHHRKRRVKEIAKYETAMKMLATTYTEQLQGFKKSENPLEAMKFLNNSENIWKKNSAIIFNNGEFDDKEFILKIRNMSLEVMENKLLEASEICSKDSSVVNVSFCIAILSVMDTILEEFGESINSKKRQKYREISRQFK